MRPSLLRFQFLFERLHLFLESGHAVGQFSVGRLPPRHPVHAPLESTESLAVFL